MIIIYRELQSVEGPVIIRGYDAINAAKNLKRPLGKYSEESHRGFRMDLTVEEADKLASEDENLIFLDVDVQKLGMEELLTLSAALGGGQGKSFAQLRDMCIQQGDDDRAAIFDDMAVRWSQLKSKSH